MLFRKFNAEHALSPWDHVDSKGNVLQVRADASDQLTKLKIDETRLKPWRWEDQWDFAEKKTPEERKKDNETGLWVIPVMAPVLLFGYCFVWYGSIF